MEYFLYWGCALEAGDKHYLVSIEPVAEVLGIHFREIEDWNCCGASIGYIGGNELSGEILAARNLALAESQGHFDIVAPCSSCYVVLNKVNRELQANPAHLAKVNSILAVGNLNYKGSLKVRHIQDVLINDVGVDKIKAAVKHPLTGVKVAGYVGCQTVRPYGEYDSVEKPVVMDKLLAALGAEVVQFDSKMVCCGSGIFFTEQALGFQQVDKILTDIEKNGGQIVSTACPMCQMNLEVYQKKINDTLGTNHCLPIVFITQLMAVAFGLHPNKAAALNHNIIPAAPVLLCGH
ncbi:MAG: CoB--CoM heterodisulfide reductase iron-sulfur subunit B family protein [Deltaproteobacteria bacterium]|nr:CoB--CoM heterodisulfide reductase iron-sulfur subunit B family protein [Deltaproteobacteria bacterium]